MVVPGASERLNDEERKGLGMSPKRALLDAFCFPLLYYIKHIEKSFIDL